MGEEGIPVLLGKISRCCSRIGECGESQIEVAYGLLGDALDAYEEVHGRLGIAHEDDPYRELGRLVMAGRTDVADRLAMIIQACTATGLLMGKARTFMTAGHEWDVKISDAPVLNTTAGKTGWQPEEVSSAWGTAKQGTRAAHPMHGGGTK